MTSAKKRWFAVLAVVFVGAVAGVVVWPKEKEPEYQGRKLSEWVSRGYNQNSRYETELATEAMRAIGTNALPFLLKWIQNGSVPRWHRYAFSSARKLPLGSLRDRMFELATDNSNERRAESAWFGFWVLGSNADSAVPELTRMLQSDKDFVRHGGVSALAAIGSDGLAPLLAAAQDEHYKSRTTVIEGICESQVAADSEEGRNVIQFALRCLKDKNPDVSRTAAGWMPTKDFELTVPALIEFFGHADWEGRVSTIATFERFGTNAHPAIFPTLIAALNDSDANVRGFATNVLDRVAPAPARLERLK